MNRLGGDENYWWTITLSDLALLLLGFALLWHASAKVAIESLPPGEKNLLFAPRELQSQAKAWQVVGDDWTKFVVAAGLQNDLDIDFTASEMLLSLRDAASFASGKADLPPRALPVLDKVAATLLVHADLSASIGGHTDSLRIARADFPSNWQLSTARASRVARYLIAKGVHPARLSVQGFADYQPREANSTTTGRRASRRVEIRLMQKSPRQGK
jgi:flagellar motor protein MotB